MPLLQDTALNTIKGIGPKLSEKLTNLGLSTLQDILFFLPYKYQDRSHLVPISHLRPGGEFLTQGKLIDSRLIFARQRMLICQIQADDGAILTLKFFHFNKQQQSSLVSGQIIRCFGEPRAGRNSLEMTHPEYRIISDPMQPVEDSYTPIYHQIKGVSQFLIRRIVKQALDNLNDDSLHELLPQQIRDKYQYPSLASAIRFLHQPPVDSSFNDLVEKNTPYHQRIAFEELLAHQLSVCHQVQQLSLTKPSFTISEQSRLQVNQFISTLPFALTNAQKKVVNEINNDLSDSTPMWRLLQGDVGSGKTIVAAITILYAVNSGFQAVLMAPTELLAEQLYSNMQNWFADLGVQISYLSGKIKGKLREKTLIDIEQGNSQLVIGTHALFQQQVIFNRLGLVIIDEQHRFGVEQRLNLLDKAKTTAKDNQGRAHLLVMTATPIPRTLAMTAYADLSISIIDQLPPGRKPVNTIIVPQSRRDEVIERIYQACKQGKQCYWICTLIEESEVLQCQAAENTFKDLSSQLSGILVGLVHGRMNNDQKTAVMADFKQGKIQLLISTTVVEVGVDVPNASLMIIENAERLGLSQLHQLRGRVGRGALESSCVLIYGQPISNLGKKRLKVIRQTSDGFKIAEQDLKIRGPGEFLGVRQTGLAQMKVADLIQDQHLIEPANMAAKWMINNNNPSIEKLIDRWIGRNIEFKKV